MYKQLMNYRHIAKLYRSIVCDCIIERHPSHTEYHDCPLSEVRGSVDCPLDIESELALAFHSVYDWLEATKRLHISKLPSHVVNRQVTYKQLLDLLTDKQLIELIAFNEAFYEEYDYDSIDNPDYVYINLYIIAAQILKPYIIRLFHPKYWSIPDVDSSVLRVYV